MANSTLSPTKGTPGRPLTDDHIDELLAQAPKRSWDDEVEIIDDKTAELKDLLEHLKEISRRQPPVPPYREPSSGELEGSRYFPDGFPTCDSLYSNAERPQPLENALPIYKFPNCKHSACYVCTFIHLEHSWDCPECGRTMHEAPRRDYGLEEEIRRENPRWIDFSRHRYSFDGFRFPPASSQRCLVALG
ncbi:hypothetical protein C8F01DRAFT_1089316 [Mycena amicta]|nr:hypothetical protein C8F01DRAFT_1089316 [Mycena amicta]